MLFHIAIIMLMMSALAAFLILWYFWVKRRLAGSCFLDDEQQILFPFKYFSWVLLGVVFVTCVAQVHFVRVSSRLHESLVAREGARNCLQMDQTRFDELKEILRTVRGDLNSGFKRMAAHRDDRAEVQGLDGAESLTTRPRRGVAKTASACSLPSAERVKGPVAFDKAAGTYSAHSARSATRKAPRKEKKEERESKVWSMNLDLMGQVTANVLRVREHPEETAPVIERLKAGSVVRVKEKRFVDDSLWFKIESPSERAGWVDFRYLKLLTSAKPVTN